MCLQMNTSLIGRRFVKWTSDQSIIVPHGACATYRRLFGIPGVWQNDASTCRLLYGWGSCQTPPPRCQTSSVSYAFGPQWGTENTQSTTYCIMFQTRLRRSISPSHPCYFLFTYIFGHSMSKIHTTNINTTSFIGYCVSCFLYCVTGILMASAIE